jgi:hypothetical protein
MNQFRRLGERHDRDRHAASIKFAFQGLHLAEVSLAWQSSQMP